MYDTSGHLFVASDDSLGTDVDTDTVWFKLNMKYGINTINEVRQARGENPVPWGDTPWLDLNKAPTNFPDSHRVHVDRDDFSRYTGRNRRPKDDPNAVMSADESDTTPENQMI